MAQLVEQLTLNQWVPGSSPGGCTDCSGPAKQRRDSQNDSELSFTSLLSSVVMEVGARPATKEAKLPDFPEISKLLSGLIKSLFTHH